MKTFLFRFALTAIYTSSCTKEECPVIIPENATIVLLDTLMMYDTIVQTDSVLIFDTVLYSYKSDSPACQYNSICLDTSFYNPINVNDVYFSWTFPGFIEKDNSRILRSNPNDQDRNPYIVFYEDGSVSGHCVFNRFDAHFTVDSPILDLSIPLSTDGPEGDYSLEYGYALNDIDPGYIKIEGDNMFLHPDSKILVFTID